MEEEQNFDSNCDVYKCSRNGRDLKCIFSACNLVSHIFWLIPLSINSSNYNYFIIIIIMFTAWKVSKYGVISCPYFPAFGMNTKIYEVNTGK